MPKLPRLTSDELVRILVKAGWQVSRQRGSHVSLRWPEGGRRPLVVPAHGKQLKTGTLAAILRDADLSVEDVERFR